MSKKYEPGHEPPPIAERPRCGYCDKPLRPIITAEWVRVERPLGPVIELPATGRLVQTGGGFESKRGPSSWLGKYQSYGHFCTLRCADAFANAAYRAGYRITTTKD